jgi:GTP-binding protein
MQFVDKIDLSVRAGRGGSGLVSFLHSKYKENGGPDGGNGGQGGDIILIATHNSSTLSKYRVNRLYKAQNGQDGGKNTRQGANGTSIELNVPVGTMIYENDKLIADLAENGQKEIVANGGKGGFGNAHFKSSTRQTPRFAELGEEGEKKKLTLELKMIADVGLVGLPNSGKSTLLSVISNAKPEIADYPFTTIVPNLGVVDFNQESCLVADIPGLIEGASQGKGLGDEFLRHIERTRAILQLVDINSTNWQKDFDTIQKELKDYKIDLSKKQRIVVLSKSDIFNFSPSNNQKIDSFRAKNGLILGKNFFVISAIAKRNLTQMLGGLFSTLAKPQKEIKKREKLPVISLENDPNSYTVLLEKNLFVITGKKIEGFARRTDFSQPQAVGRLRDILSKLGIAKEIHRLGGAKGSKLKIAGKIFVL